MTLQLTKHIEPDCSMPQTQETGRERRQRQKERGPKWKEQNACVKDGLSVWLLQKNLSEDYSPPTVIRFIITRQIESQTSTNLCSWSILSEKKNIRGPASCLFKCVCIALGTANARLQKGVCCLLFWPKKGQLKNPAFANMLWLKWHKNTNGITN